MAIYRARPPDTYVFFLLMRSCTAHRVFFSGSSVLMLSQHTTCSSISRQPTRPWPHSIPLTSLPPLDTLSRSLKDSSRCITVFMVIYEILSSTSSMYIPFSLLLSTSWSSSISRHWLDDPSPRGFSSREFFFHLSRSLPSISLYHFLLSLFSFSLTFSIRLASPMDLVSRSLQFSMSSHFFSTERQWKLMRKPDSKLCFVFLFHFGFRGECWIVFEQGMAGKNVFLYRAGSSLRNNIYGGQICRYSLVPYSKRAWQ